MEPTQCSETSAFNTQTPGKYPEDNLSIYFLFILQKADDKNTVTSRYMCSLLYLLYRSILMVLQRLFSIAHGDAYAPCPWSLPLKNQFPHNITEYKNTVIRWDKIWTVFRIKENLLLQCSICFNSHLCHVTSSSHDAKQPATAIFCVYCN
jgi:hypothetical protein